MSCRQFIIPVRILYTVRQPCEICLCRKFHLSPTYNKIGKSFKGKKPLAHAIRDLEEAQNEKVKRTKLIKRKSIPIYPNMPVLKLAQALGKKKGEVRVALEYASKDQISDIIEDVVTIQKVVKIFGFSPRHISPPDKIHKKESEDWRESFIQPPPDPSVLIRRPPVVTVMGHVDHGKTTLLDSIRNSNVVAQEFGGITQHIGAFSVKISSGETMTFLDTPGHAAFSAMRSRGASITDIIILVVAADDGVMPQTVESIEHAKEANVPIIVAINKIDKPGVDIEHTEQMLLQHDLISERLGGDVQCIPVSALKGTNLDQLQEAVITQAEMLDLKGDPVGLVEGHVIESRTIPGRGKAVTVIVERGTLKKGDYILAGVAYAKVRSMFTDKGVNVEEATLSTPVEVFGWKELPSVGDHIMQFKTEKKLKDILQYNQSLMMKDKMEKDSEVIEEKRKKHQMEYSKELHKKQVLGLRSYNISVKRLYMKPKEEEIHHEGPLLRIIIKGDVDGSLDAILDTLGSYRSQMCRLDLIHHGIGEVTINDVEMAQLFNGEIFAFNVPVSDTVRDLAEDKGVVIHEDNVIYRLFDNLLESLNNRLPTIEEEEIIGEAHVREIFTYTVKKQKVTIAGCQCVSGILQRKLMFKLIRNGEELYKGTLMGLKHEKTDVSVVQKGSNCGITLSDTSIVMKPGDELICFKNNIIGGTIDWTPGF